MKRFTRRRSAAAVLALVVALCVLVMSTGNAARLDLNADGSIPFAQGAKRCTDGPLTVSPSGTPVAGRYTEVTVSGITGDCVGGNVSVFQGASPHTVLFSGSGTVSGSTMKVTAPAFTPATGLGVVVGLDGWAVPAVWHFTPPAPVTGCVALLRDGTPDPRGSCTVTGITLNTPWGSAGSRQTNGHVRVNATSSYVQFTVDLRAYLPADWNWSTTGLARQNSQNPHYFLAPGYSCDQLPVLVGTSNPGWSTIDLYLDVRENRATISAGNRVCG